MKFNLRYLKKKNNNNELCTAIYKYYVNKHT